MARFGREADSWFTGSDFERKSFACTLFFGGANQQADLRDEEADRGFPSFRDVS